MDYYASKRVVPHYERPKPYTVCAVQAVPQQNTGVARTLDMASLYGGANRLLSDEQIQQFITSTVLPHHRELTSPDHSKISVQYVAPKAVQVSQRGVETGLQTTPITPAKFMEAGSPTKRCPPSYLTEGSGPQSPKTQEAGDRIAALAGVNSFLSDEQIKQFITSTVLPHHRALTNPQLKNANNSKQNKINISAGESNRRPVVQVPDQTNISPLGAQRGVVSGFQETWGENCNSNGLSSQGSPSTLVPSTHGTATSSMVPVRYARTNSMETQSLMATSMPAIGTSSNGAVASRLSVNGVSANGESTAGASARNALDRCVTANHVSAKGLSANHVSANGLSANHVSANDGSASQHHQPASVPHAQTLSLVSHTMPEGLKNEETQTAQKDKQILSTPQSSHLASQIQIESPEQDSPVGLPDTKKNKSKALVVKSRAKNHRKERKSPKKRGKDLKSTGSPKKRRKVASESQEAEVQQCQESQGNTHSDSEISPDDDDFFNDCLQEFFDRLVLAEVPSEGQQIILPGSDPKNIIPCENYYIDLSLFL